jgi:copper chaperone CopZ
MEHCADQGQKIVHTVQSDRSFSLSYADSLSAQGKPDDAERIRDCVKQAGYSPAAMQRCRNLADDLLFG